MRVIVISVNRPKVIAIGSWLTRRDHDRPLLAGCRPSKARPLRLLQVSTLPDGAAQANWLKSTHNGRRTHCPRNVTCW